VSLLVKEISFQQNTYVFDKEGVYVDSNFHIHEANNITFYTYYSNGELLFFKHIGEFISYFKTHLFPNVLRDILEDVQYIKNMKSLRRSAFNILEKHKDSSSYLTKYSLAGILTTSSQGGYELSSTVTMVDMYNALCKINYLTCSPYVTTTKDGMYYINTLFKGLNEQLPNFEKEYMELLSQYNSHHKQDIPFEMRYKKEKVYVWNHEEGNIESTFELITKRK
jgi:hypothetical protein